MRVFGWILFVVFGVGGVGQTLWYAFNEKEENRLAKIAMAAFFALFWLWLAGSYILGLY